MNDTTTVLEASGLCRSYVGPGGELAVLQGVDLTVERGTMVAIIGASGAGKSTLLNILGTLDHPDEGTVTVQGRRVDGLTERELADFRARHLGFIFQFHHLLPEFSAVENVMMPLLIAGRDAGEARAEAEESLASVGLAERREHRPSELSVGEAQRVAAARALVSQPQLVLADEPTGNLDQQNADALHQLMASMTRERHQTFVVVTHSDRLARVADRVLRLQDGRLTPA